MATMLDTERFRGRVAASQGTGGSGGGSVDDTQRRLGILETAIGEIKIILSGLATRTELEQTRGALSKELEQLRGATCAGFEKVHGDIREIKATLPHLATQANMEGVRTEIAVLRGEIGELHATIIKWIVGTVLATGALAFSVARFVL